MRLPYGGVSLPGFVLFLLILSTVILIEAHFQGLYRFAHWAHLDRNLAFDLYALQPWRFVVMVDEGTIDAQALHSLISSGFLHIGWGHLAFNMLPFAVLGWLTLRRSGSFGLLVVYFGVMVLAGLAYVAGATLPALAFLDAGSPFSRLIGASGAVHGLGGAWVVWAYLDRRGAPLHRIWPSALWFGFILAVNGYLYVAMDGGFAWSLHVAGVVFGMLIAPLIPVKR